MIKNDYKIVPLPKEEWKGTPILMRYTTEEYYDLEKKDSADSFSAKMRIRFLPLITFPHSLCWRQIALSCAGFPGKMHRTFFLLLLIRRSPGMFSGKRTVRYLNPGCIYNI